MKGQNPTLFIDIDRQYATFEYWLDAISWSIYLDFEFHMECNLLEVGIHEFQKLRASLGDTSHSEELVSDMVWSSTTSVVEVGSWFTFPVVILQWVWYILIPDMICILLYWYIYILYIFNKIYTCRCMNLYITFLQWVLMTDDVYE